MSIVDQTITLNVGGGTFTFLRSTAEKSHCLSKMLCDDEDSEGLYYNEQGDLFLDRDKDMFAYVLQWLREGKINVQDETTLLDLRDEAEYFELDELAAEINRKLKIVQADNIHYSLLDPDELKNLSELNIVNNKPTTPGIDKNYRVITSINYTEKVWQCPREIFLHYSPEYCGRKCNALMLGDHTGWIDVKRIKYLVAKYT